VDLPLTFSNYLRSVRLATACHTVSVVSKQEAKGKFPLVELGKGGLHIFHHSKTTFTPAEYMNSERAALHAQPVYNKWVCLLLDGFKKGKSLLPSI